MNLNKNINNKHLIIGFLILIVFILLALNIYYFHKGNASDKTVDDNVALITTQPLPSLNFEPTVSDSPSQSSSPAVTIVPTEQITPIKTNSDIKLYTILFSNDDINYNFSESTNDWYISQDKNYNIRTLLEQLGGTNLNEALKHKFKLKITLENSQHKYVIYDGFWNSTTYRLDFKWLAVALPGTYEMRWEFDVDNRIGETDESNNTFTKSVKVIDKNIQFVRSRPLDDKPDIGARLDVQKTHQTEPLNEYKPGEGMVYFYGFNNYSNRSIAELKYQLFYDDELIFERIEKDMGPDFRSGPRSALFNAPNEPGEHQLIFKADTDNIVDESNETNNTIVYNFVIKN